MEILERDKEKQCYIDQEEQATAQLLPRYERKVCFPKKTKQKIPERQHKAVQNDQAPKTADEGGQAKP